MSTRDAASTHGRCWFCAQRPGDLNSLALPFWSNEDDRVQVLIIPRCTPCFQHHEQHKIPSGAFLIGGIAGFMLLAKVLFLTVLPLSDGWQTAGMVLAMLIGLAAGLIFVSAREASAAAAAGTKPSSAWQQHPEYQALAQDRAHWRDRYSAASTGGAYRRETVLDRRLEFQASTQLANAATALEQAVQESGIQT